MELRIRALDSESKPVSGSRAVALSLCAEHGVQLWRTLSAQIEQLRDGGVS